MLPGGIEHYNKVS